MRTFKIAAYCAGAWLLAGGIASADVQLSIADGRVSLVATDATVRQILTEWARVGQTRIVNIERVPGGPITLELHDVTEAQALDTILRSVSGYMAAPRPQRVASASQFDRIIVMPTSAAPPQPVRSASQPTFQAPPAMQSPQVFPAVPPPPAQVPAGDDADDQPQAGPARSGPVFNPFPPPQVNPQQGVTPYQAPLQLPAAGGQGAIGAATPGMIVQPPQQPGQPVVPGAPRRPGGGD